MSEFDSEFQERYFNKKWFDKNHLMAPYGENGILFLAEYLAANDFPEEWRERVIVAIGAYRNEDGRWITKGESDLSHDNFTAIVCLSANYGLDYHKSVWRKDLVHCMLHPRDAIFYASMSHISLRILLLPLYLIPLLAQFVSCWTTWKVRGENRMLKTDGKLLTWLRCKSFKMPFTSWICSRTIKRNADFGSWKKCFNIYFRDAEHPLNIMIDSKYELSYNGRWGVLKR